MSLADFNLDSFSLTGKNAIVTGGNSGLGQAFSVALATAGANIFVPSIVAGQGETKRLVEAKGSRYHYANVDITAEGVAQQSVLDCQQLYGSVDILVNCAGISLLADVESFGREQWDRMVQVNLTAAFEFSHHAAKGMIEQGRGKIINICSLFSFLGGRESPAYAATKHGIAGLTKAYCDELAQYNVQVNGIAPGYFDTALTQNSMNDPVAKQKILEHIPAGKVGCVSDLMGAAVFLASEASNYVNGHILTVDGGYLVR
ncbi:MAG: SDR family NAD(P)-dependent oxidoreductase [Pseudomonadota bacterium]